jgi:hypothetical protein
MEKRKKRQHADWSQRTLYEALVDRGERVGTSELGALVTLYFQPLRQNCAYLLPPGSKWDSEPIHLHPGRISWKPEVYAKILPALGRIRREPKGVPKQAFLFCEVKDWNLLAEALGF